MKSPYRLSVICGLSLVLAQAAMLAQNLAPKPVAVPNKDEVVVLSPFLTYAESVSPYQADEATAATRVSVNLFDSSSTISVLTSAFLKDTGSTNAIDSLKYIAGIAESTQPVGGDRMEIRGFQTDGQTIDGFTRNGPYNHLDTVIYDRVEMVKGPNAILNPSGQPGGTVNYVSKKADFKNNSEITVQVGEYDANKVSFDFGRVLSKNASLRVVGSGTYAKGYYHDTDHAYTLMPSATFQWGGTNRLTLQGLFQTTHRTFVGGVPISPTASSTNLTTTLWPGVARNADPYIDVQQPRNESGQHYQAFYTGSITDNLSVRLAGHVLFDNHRAIQFTNSPASVGGLAVTGASYINPFTGYYDPTKFWGGAPGFTTTAAPTPDNMFNRSQFSSFERSTQIDIHNDYAYRIKRENYNATTTAGILFTRTRSDNRNDNYTLPAFNILGPYVYTPYTDLGIAANVTGINSISEEYLNQNIELFKKRLILSGGISHNTFHSRVDDLVLKASRLSATNRNFANYGVVTQPLKDLSLYYGFSEAALLTAPGVGSSAPPLQSGKQFEAGARYKFFQGRGLVTATYFTVKQNNVTVPNPGNLLFPAPVPPLPGLASDRVARGWEFSANIAFDERWSMLGNYTTFRNRDVNGSPIRGTAEQSGAVWLQYHPAKTGPLSRFGVGLGVSYSSKRAGDTQTGFAAASVIAGTPVIKQPTFWLPAYYREDLSISYQANKNWSVRCFVENLFDTNYLAGSLNRNSVVVGLPLNVKASVTYSF